MPPRFTSGMLLAISALFPATIRLQAQGLSFTHKFDLGVNSRAAADATGVYIAATTGDPNKFYSTQTAVIRKYDSSGIELWTRRMDEISVAAGIAVSDAGIYVAGEAGWQPPGNGIDGRFADAFVRLYNLDGNELWTRRFSDTESIDGFTAISAAAADSTGVFLTIWTGALTNGTVKPGSVLLRKLDAQGVEQWSAGLPAGYTASAIAVENNAAYLVGTVSANLSPPRPPAADFISKYDAAGKESWTRQFYTNAGGDYGYPTGIAVTGGDLYVTGRRFAYPAGGALAFVRAFDGGGNDKWTNQFSGANTQGILSDGEGLYIVGSVFGTLPGQCSAGSFDAIVRRYDMAGNELWTHQFGTNASDEPDAVTMDANAVYVVGSSWPSPGSFLSRLEKKSAAATAAEPRIRYECVVNAANFLGGGVAPGEIVTIQGSSMGPVEPVSFTPGTTGVVGSSLAGARVLFNGIAGPMLFASSDRLTAVVPLALKGGTTVDVQVEYRGVGSKSVTLPVLETRPGVFTLDGSGTGQAAALNQNGSINSPSNPAARGSTVVLYATGGGPGDSPVADGQILVASIPQLRAAPSVVFTSDQSLGTPDWLDFVAMLGSHVEPPFGGVLYAGGAAGLIQGVIQINVRLPDIPGNQISPAPLQVFYGDPANAVVSGGVVTIAVQ